MRKYTFGLLLCLSSLWTAQLWAVPTIANLRPCFADADDAAFAKAHYRYTESGKLETQQMLQRFQQLETLFDEVLQMADAPRWLKYIPLAESRLKLDAVSMAGAAGLWQIMPRTGRGLGLQINSAVDERLDPVLATQAAVAYLLKLHATFDDWLLALAAYNCGAGNVRKAQKKAGAYHYAAIRDYLPAQTRRYLPRVFTIAAIAQNPPTADWAQFPSVAPLQAIVLRKSSTLKQVARCLSLPITSLRAWNPAFRNGRINVKEESVTLWLPREVLQSAALRAQVWQLNSYLYLPQEPRQLPFSVVGVELV